MPFTDLVHKDRTSPFRARLRASAKAIKRDVMALYLAAHDPRVPWYAKAAAGCVAAYALSPIDLIPDFVPVLGYLDDIIIVPVGILLVVRLVPAAVMTDLRTEAEERTAHPVSRAGAAVIVAIWLAVAMALVWSAVNPLHGQ
jgi:uncharacterized membrane protein YkvA (DUF1232 family)